MEKHFIDSKRSEILSVFLILKVFPCTMQIALFWPKLLPSLPFLASEALIYLPF
jgi:hypothetical protein